MMNKHALTLGTWSAALCVLTFLIFSICFMAIAMINPLFSWTNLANYAQYVASTNQTFKDIAQFMMLLFGPLFVILVASIHETAAEQQKIFSRLALIFAAIFAALISLNYFVQLSIVRQNLNHANLEGLQHFIQANPASFITAGNMLGWSLFLGLSSFFLVPLFKEGRLQKTIRIAFLSNGIIVMLGGLSYIFEMTILVFILMNLAMGAAIFIATIALTLHFRRLQWM